MDAITALMTRRSVRNYKPDPIKPEDLATILDCGRYAPSATNSQGWRFVVITDDDLRQKIAQWMPYGKHIAQAPASIVVLTSDEGTYGPHEDAPAATMCMMLAAHALGYGTCWIACYDNPAYQQIAKELGAPEGWTMMTLFTLGVPDGEPRSAAKKTLEEVVSYNGF